MTSSPVAPESTEKPGYPIESVDRALSLLLIFETTDMISVSEAGQVLGVSRSTAYRLLNMLQYRGFVRQDARTKAYMAGPALLRVGLAAVQQLDVRAAVRTLLERVVEKVDETAHCVCLQRADTFFLDCHEGTKMVRAAPRVGTSLPAHCTSGGKVLLAALPRYRLDAIFPDGRLRTLTKHSIASMPKLLKELDQIREQGYAIDDEESELGQRAVSVRVDHPHVRLSVDAAITISGPKDRMTDELIQACLAETRKVMESELA